MKLATIKLNGTEKAAVVMHSGFVPVETVDVVWNRTWSTELGYLLVKGELAEMNEWYRSGGNALREAMEAISIPFWQGEYAPPFRNPRKIWGIGANYAAKAADMAVTPPDGEPICFLKPDTSLIGPGDDIVLPLEPHQVTAEAEIGIVIGKACKHVREEDALDVIAGFTPTLDMTAQDIHAKNPRFLGRSKCFDTFFSFGPHLITPDECPDSAKWTIETVLNGQSLHRSAVSAMIYPIPFIVSYFSRMMTLLPGDIIMTGTPGSVPLQPGDTVECRIAGFETLRNTVAREKSPRALSLCEKGEAQ